MRFDIENAFLFRELNSISKKEDLTMYGKMFTGMICLTLLGGTFFVPKVQADESDEKTIVSVNEPFSVLLKSPSRRTR